MFDSWKASAHTALVIRWWFSFLMELVRNWHLIFLKVLHSEAVHSLIQVFQHFLLSICELCRWYAQFPSEEREREPALIDRIYVWRRREALRMPTWEQKTCKYKENAQRERIVSQRTFFHKRAWQSKRYRERREWSEREHCNTEFFKAYSSIVKSRKRLHDLLFKRFQYCPSSLFIRLELGSCVSSWLCYIASP